MEEILVLSSKNYTQNDTINYGDCIIINTGSDLIVYDCGHEEHARVALQYMDSHGFETAKLILSHNDSDHYAGIQTLLDSGRISAVITTLLLKYVDDILERIDDKRRSREGVKKEIIDKYDNIANLSGAQLKDVYEPNTYDLPTSISIIGPDKEYMFDTVAKLLDGRTGDTQDGETAINATSIQVEVKQGNHSILLCGDCCFAAIEDIVQNFDCIQLPHHGKSKQAEAIWKKKAMQPTHSYFVSDNTGSSNGGSDNLDTTGHRVLNTKTNGDIVIDSAFFSRVHSWKTLGKWYALYY